MIWTAGPIDKCGVSQGMYRPLLAETPEKGLDGIMSELTDFYARRTGFEFEMAAESVSKPGTHPTWYNKVYFQGAHYADVNIQHLGSQLDNNPPPAKIQQLYAVYFNVKGDNQAQTKNRQERDLFLEFIKRQR